MAGHRSPSTRRLLSDKRGATLVEFAVVAPIFLGMVMGLFDASFYLFARSVLSGEVDAAARSSTLETATDANRLALDNRVTEQVQRLVPHGNVTFSRVAFSDYRFAQARAEPFTDGNSNNTCDNNEAFVDLNDNGRHDLDGGRNGNGRARDVIIYTATLTYDRLFPVDGLLGLSKTATVEATTLLRNQPFDSQVQPTTRNCT
ncbi:MAG: TadE/TadG family type IV pilus assembly protein [Erythrobacter sp.]